MKRLALLLFVFLFAAYPGVSYSGPCVDDRADLEISKLPPVEGLYARSEQRLKKYVQDVLIVVADAGRQRFKHWLTDHFAPQVALNRAIDLVMRRQQAEGVSPHPILGDFVPEPGHPGVSTREVDPVIAQHERDVVQLEAEWPKKAAPGDEILGDAVVIDDAKMEKTDSKEVFEVVGKNGGFFRYHPDVARRTAAASILNTLLGLNLWREPDSQSSVARSAARNFKNRWARLARGPLGRQHMNISKGKI